MTLKPTVVSPATIKSRRPLKDRNMPAKMMVIDCKNDTQWNAIHALEVNGVVLRRRPIRAIESFLDGATGEVFAEHEFVCVQSRLRSELNKRLVLANEEDEMRRKFLVNDITSWVRVLIRQSRSRDFLFKLNSHLPSDFHADPNQLKMLVTYRAQKITFRQPKDKDERDFSPYGVALFRGQAYPTPVEWRAETSSDKAFYLTIEPASRRMRR
ncbi:DUF1826 domain-containing protein [Terasakiella sp. A23]|uniref:DUF1826 domain-containing protein n=1 Tax=Terasakiella sp. FCG-A23 TaxID=3080561 RepID=UPI0029531A93|nr:DUF1826 domain-containing protein [Terasakiella sp. A23]MDV7338717.1 DUF1826 domain-containing protein [Terasakiella sp. A23]